VEPNWQLQQVAPAYRETRRANDLWDRSISTNDHAVPKCGVQLTVVAIRPHVIEQLLSNIGAHAKRGDDYCRH
jgi:hypothetical protein